MLFVFLLKYIFKLNNLYFKQNSLINPNFILPSVTSNSSSVGPSSLSVGPQQQQLNSLTSENGVAVALSQLLAANPQILQQATLAQNPPAIPQNGTLLQNPLISALAAQLLLPQNHFIQQQQQQQMLNILQLIQNPNLLAYHNFLQQQNNNPLQNISQHQTNLLPVLAAQNPLQNSLNLLNQLIQINGNSTNNLTSNLQQGTFSL